MKHEFQQGECIHCGSDNPNLEGTYCKGGRDYSIFSEQKLVRALRSDPQNPAILAEALARLLERS